MCISRESTSGPVVSGTTSRSERAGARISILVLTCLALGFAAGAYWYYRAAQRSGASVDQEAGPRLSEGTRAVLRQLDSPVEIRFYSLLGQENVSEALRAFAGRADQLVSAFQQAADGKITVARHNAPSDAEIAAAESDGIRPSNLDKGDACYLGFAVVQEDQKESLPQIAPEWEPALEADLTRAIVRVASARQQVVRVVEATQVDLAAAEDVQRSLPNLASLSAEEGTRILREAALKEFKAAATEMQTQIQQAQERFSQAQTAKSEAEQQAALEQLRQLQAAQTEKLKDIATRLQTQIAALERLKGVPAAAKEPETSPKR